MDSKCYKFFCFFFRRGGCRILWHQWVLVSPKHNGSGLAHCEKLTGWALKLNQKVASQVKIATQTNDPTASNRRKHCSKWWINTKRWAAYTDRERGYRERRRERNERARETALNIDGALCYGSIRQPPSHNYTSACSRMIHHMDTHDYILPALGPKSVCAKTIQRGKNRNGLSNLFTLLKPLCMTLIPQFASQNGNMSV